MWQKRRSLAAGRSRGRKRKYVTIVIVCTSLSQAVRSREEAKGAGAVLSGKWVRKALEKEYAQIYGIVMQASGPHGGDAWEKRKSQGQNLPSFWKSALPNQKWH